MNRRVLITGANRGFGFALTQAFVTAGDKVIAVVRNKEHITFLEDKFGDNVVVIHGDISDDQSIDSIKSGIKDLSTIDVIINNAGVVGTAHEIEEVDTEELLYGINVHCMAVVRTFLACKDKLLESKNPLILNISSRLGSLTRMASGEFKGRHFSYSYRIAKACQNMLTICMDQELQDKGIRVVAIHPGRLITRSGARDANTEPHEAADELLDWLETATIKETTYFEIGGQKLPW